MKIDCIVHWDLPRILTSNDIKCHRQIKAPQSFNLKTSKIYESGLESI